MKIGYLQLEKQNLQEENQYDKILQNCLNNNKTYIIAKTGICYTIDHITGEIVEYPFEKMDSYQLYEPVEYESQKIIIVTTNEQNKLTEEELLQGILEQMNLQ